MKRLLLTTFLATVVALATAASADQAPAAIGEGEFGCCCAWSEWAGLCPMDFLAFWNAFADTCFLLDDDGNIVGFCDDDPDGAYLFRVMNWPERAEFIAQNHGIEATVGSMFDFFCGIDRTRAPGSE